MDVLETYPRDELFQTPVEDLVPIAAQVMYTRERRQLKLFVRRDIYGRFLSCLVYLPRDRYNTTVRERIAAILKEQLARRQHRVHRARRGVLRRAAALRRPPGAGRADRRARHRRPRAPLRRGGALLARRLHRRGHLDVRRGAGQPARAAATPTASRRPTRRTTRRRPARSTSAGSSRSRATRGMALSLYEDVAAPPGEARLKVYRIGPPLSLSEVLPILSTIGVEVVDERPYQLEGLERESYIYDFGLRYHRGDARPRARAVPGHRRRGVERLQRERRLQRPGPRGRPRPGARRRCCAPTPSTCARAAPRSRRTTSRTRCATTSTSPATWCSCSRRASTPARATATHRRRTARRGRPSAPTSRSASCARSTRSPASTTTASCAPT